MTADSRAPAPLVTVDTEAPTPATTVVSRPRTPAMTADSRASTPVTMVDSRARTRSKTAAFRPQQSATPHTEVVPATTTDRRQLIEIDGRQFLFQHGYRFAKVP